MLILFIESWVSKSPLGLDPTMLVKKSSSVSASSTWKTQPPFWRLTKDNKKNYSLSTTLSGHLMDSKPKKTDTWRPLQDLNTLTNRVFSKKSETTFWTMLGKVITVVYLLTGRQDLENHTVWSDMGKTK